jgi:hypothetical protein
MDQDNKGEFALEDEEDGFSKERIKDFDYNNNNNNNKKHEFDGFDKKGFRTSRNLRDNMASRAFKDDFRSTRMPITSNGRSTEINANNDRYMNQQSRSRFNVKNIKG